MCSRGKQPGPPAKVPKFQHDCEADRRFQVTSGGGAYPHNENVKRAGDEEKEKRSRLPKSAVGELGEQDEPLFQKLRALRLEIAREEKIPPYMVFSDKTLIHMCILKPGNEEEMLNVTGVGRHKYEKYGKRFIDAVKNL